MDVKFEDSNVDRFTDLTTSNHASSTPGTPPMPDADAPAPPDEDPCAKYEINIKTHKEHQKETHGGSGKESHHVMQNAFFQQPRGTNISGVCPGYDTDKAPCIVLATSPHKAVSAQQASDAAGFRRAEKNPTYKQAREASKNQIKKSKSPEMSDEEAECIMIKVDKMVKDMCPNINDNTEMRAPGQRSAWQPTVGTSGGGSVGSA
jgi:hypothetical protein